MTTYQTKQGIGLVVILSALMAITSLATDSYLPAMPEMARDLQGNVEFTITGFLIGFAIAQLLWGPISDRIGRKRPMLIGMVIFIIGSIGCALSTSIEQIVFWRIFQAFGACTGPMLARAMVRDLFSASRAVQVLSTLTIIVAVAPIAGPLIGGQIVGFASWHWNFWFVAALAVLMFISIFRLPESLTPAMRTEKSLLATFANYAVLCKQLSYMRYVLCVTFFYVAAYAFITASPEVYIQYFGVSPKHFGLLFALNVIGIMVMTALNRHFLKRFSIHQMLKATTLFSVLAALALMAVVWYRWGGLLAIIIFVVLFFSMTGAIAACCTAAALNQVEPNMAGSASALLGSLQYGSGVISSVLLAWFSDGTPWAMAWIIGLFAVLSASMVWFPLPHKYPTNVFKLTEKPNSENI